MSGRYDPAAVRQARADRQTAGLSLFGAWPEAPPAPANEQRALPLEYTTAGLYAAWRQQPESDAVLATLRRIALDWLALDPTRPMIGPRTLWEAARQELNGWGLGRWVDNRLQALAVREVEDTTPELRGRFRHRVLKESAAA
jgi:hypothetical protein